MPYPAKISTSSVLAAALERLEAGGHDALSMRALAGDLGVTAASLYRYYPDRAALEAAIAEAGFRLLHDALAEATAGHEPVTSAYSAARAYLAFARRRPALYDVVMEAHVHPEDAGAGPAHMGQESQADSGLWGFVLDLVGRITGRAEDADAAVALWAYLHGFVALERAGVIGARKPWSSFEAGLGALLFGLTAATRTPT
jgi:AcrR family transcriptional regulator